MTGAAVLNVIWPSRGKIVPQDVFGGVRPGAFVSDALGRRICEGVSSYQKCGKYEAWIFALQHGQNSCDITLMSSPEDQS